ncbi:MAG: DNA primase [Wigglesworthia glossinidia]|nr:DNA primase [Wigglesworthia glossinidia]
MYVSKTLINQLLSKTDIVDLISTKIYLKKSGKDYFAKCPFHYENTPSFTVSSEKQFFYCFGCGEHGNIIDFLIKYDNLSFIESLEVLSYKTGIKIVHQNQENVADNYELKQRNSMYKIMNIINIFYHKSLQYYHYNQASIYLKKRGFNFDVIQEFSIGFSNPKQISVSHYFKKSKENLSLLETSGIIIYKKNTANFVDRFKNRIMFPMKNRNGDVIAFGGRVLNNTLPKYLNSPETILFKKSNYLYGLYEIKKKNLKIIKLLLVEGYFDVITLAQYGIHYAIASLGTTTSNQIKLIYRMTNTLVCCYDGDISGKKLAWRTLIKSLPLLHDNKELFFVFLPKMEDPDTLIRKIGKSNFEKIIHHAEPMSVFLFNTLLLQHNIIYPDGKIKFLTCILPLIKRIPGQKLRLYLRKELGYKLGILEEHQLEKFLFSDKKNNIYIKNSQDIQTIMNTLIGLVVQNPKLSQLISKNQEKKLNQINLKNTDLFIKIVKICKKNIQINTAQILEYFRDNIYYCQLKQLATWNHMISKNMIELIFNETLSSAYNMILVSRQNILISRARIKGDLNKLERQELWSINKKLARK